MSEENFEFIYKKRHQICHLSATLGLYRRLKIQNKMKLRIKWILESGINQPLLCWSVSCGVKYKAIRGVFFYFAIKIFKHYIQCRMGEQMMQMWNFNFAFRPLTYSAQVKYVILLWSKIRSVEGFFFSTLPINSLQHRLFAFAIRLLLTPRLNVYAQQMWIHILDWITPTRIQRNMLPAPILTSSHHFK